MRSHRTMLTFACVALPLTACGGGGTLATFQDSASYAIGMSMGKSLEPVQDSVRLARVVQGLMDAAVEGREPKLAERELSAILGRFTTEMRAADATARDSKATKNRTEGDAYREKNMARAGVTTTPSGLQYEILTEGTGARPTATDRVRVHYRGTLVDGKEFDSSHERGEPATFAVNGIIPGWGEALKLMRVGGKYRLVIPPELGYGAQGAGRDIGPDATLIFEVELLEIVK